MTSEERHLYTRGGTAFKHSPFRAASPARQPRALARLGARAARLEPEALFPLSVLLSGRLLFCSRSWAYSSYGGLRR